MNAIVLDDPFSPPPKPKTPKEHVLLALEQFKHALLECEKTFDLPDFQPEHVRICLELMRAGVEEVRDTVQTEL